MNVSRDCEMDRRLLKLQALDNVLTAIAPIGAGESIAVAGRRVVANKDIPLGHKIAACDIPPGARVIKYGVPIGSAIVAISAGEHVHTHNLKSDYIPTYLRETQTAYFQGHH